MDNLSERLAGIRPFRWALTYYLTNCKVCKIRLKHTQSKSPIAHKLSIDCVICLTCQRDLTCFIHWIDEALRRGQKSSTVVHYALWVAFRYQHLSSVHIIHFVCWGTDKPGRIKAIITLIRSTLLGLALTRPNLRTPLLGRKNIPARPQRSAGQVSPNLRSKMGLIKNPRVAAFLAGGTFFTIQTIIGVSIGIGLGFGLRETDVVWHQRNVWGKFAFLWFFFRT